MPIFYRNFTKSSRINEISRAPFRGNKWLSLQELAARRAKLIGTTHVRTPQVRRLLPKRELVSLFGRSLKRKRCVSSETCSTHSLEQTSSPRVSPFQHPPFRGPLYVLLDGGAPDLTVAAPVSRRLVALARLVPPCQDDPLEGQR